MRFRFRVLRRKKRRTSPRRGDALYKLHKEAARARVHEKLLAWNSLYGFSFGKVAIRNSRSRWGSCSVRGNLNFHYKLIFIPEELFDYVIVHELAHLGEFNHSKKFWELVAHAIPDWKSRRTRLRAIRKIPVPRAR